MAKKPTILLVDDHVVMRSGCRELLTQAGFEIVGEACDGEEAYQLFSRLLPQIVLMDLTMYGMNGLETIRRIIHHYAHAQIIVLTMHDEPSFATRSIRSGARGYITKTSPPEILLHAIREVIRGETCFSPDIAQKLAIGTRPDHIDPVSRLSNREFDIFTLLIKGRSTMEIANTLSLTQKTVSNYLLKIKLKLKVSSVAEMVRMAINHGVDKQNVIDSEIENTGN